MTGAKPTLLSGDALRQAAGNCASSLQAKIEGEQRGFTGIFDKWFTRVLGRMLQLDPSRPWESSVQDEMGRMPRGADGLAWDFTRLRLFLDRQAQGRFVDYERRVADGEHYSPRFGMEFGSDVLLTAQGAPQMMQWRGVPLMKTVFDYALYPMLLSELRPRSVFEIGSGLGASAVWIADHLKLLDIDGHVHSADINPPSANHDAVTFSRGDCAMPDRLFAFDLLMSAPHPWLVIEDAHHNVEAVLNHFHDLLRPGDYLVIEDSEVKRDILARFVAAHPRAYKVDTKYTDYFGRNATCAGDSILKRVQEWPAASKYTAI